MGLVPERLEPMPTQRSSTTLSCPAPTMPPPSPLCGRSGTPGPGPPC